MKVEDWGPLVVVLIIVVVVSILMGLSDVVSSGK